MAKTVVKRCTCKHESQDQIYGPGKRLFNVKDGGKEAVCTVCGTKKSM